MIDNLAFSANYWLGMVVQLQPSIRLLSTVMDSAHFFFFVFFFCALFTWPLFLCSPWLWLQQCFQILRLTRQNHFFLIVSQLTRLCLLIVKKIQFKFLGQCASLVLVIVSGFIGWLIASVIYLIDRYFLQNMNFGIHTWQI